MKELWLHKVIGKTLSERDVRRTSPEVHKTGTEERRVDTTGSEARWEDDGTQPGRQGFWSSSAIYKDFGKVRPWAIA